MVLSEIALTTAIVSGNAATMTWPYQKTRWGYHELLIWKEHNGWVYAIQWHTKTAITTLGRGSEKYTQLQDARQGAVLHLANILPKPQATRLLAAQGDLVWEPWFKPRKRRSSS